MVHWGLVAVCVAALLLVLAGLWLVDGRLLPATALTRTLGLNASLAAIGAVPWLVLAPLLEPSFGSAGPLYAPIAVLGAIAAFLASAVPRAMGATAGRVLVFAGVWSVLVFVPAATLSFASDAVLDYGGSLAVNVATGSAAFGVLLMRGGRPDRLQPMSLRLGAVGVAAVVLGWMGWLAASELAVDEATPGILLAAALGAGGGLLGWLVVQRVRHQATTLNAVAAGLISGVVAITAGAPLYAPLAATVTGIVAGGAAGLFTIARATASRRPQWAVAGTHLVAGGIGLVVLGIAGTSVGFVFTGQPILAATQLAGVLGVGAWSAGVAVLLWLLVRPRITPAAG